MKNGKTPFAIPLIFFIAIIIILWRGLSLTPNLVPSPLINKSAPTFELPTLLDDKLTSNRDFLGHVTLLNIWATWCYACATEHETLMQLSQQKDFQIYGMNYKDNSEDAKRWLTEHGNPYQIIAVDKDGSVAIDWGVYGTPESYLIDKKGIIRYKHIGAISMDLWEKTLQPLINKLNLEK